MQIWNLNSFQSIPILHEIDDLVIYVCNLGNNHELLTHDYVLIYTSVHDDVLMFICTEAYYYSNK